MGFLLMLSMPSKRSCQASGFSAAGHKQALDKWQLGCCEAARMLYASTFEAILFVGPLAES